MAGERSILVIGLDPTLIDFSQPGYAPGMDAEKVLAGLKASEVGSYRADGRQCDLISCGVDASGIAGDELLLEDGLAGLGYNVQMCLTDFGETAEEAVRNRLEQEQFDCILIGAGVRTNPSNFLLFEKLINVVHKHAPQAKICFNTMPNDTAAAVKRWV